MTFTSIRFDSIQFNLINYVHGFITIARSVAAIKKFFFTLGNIKTQSWISSRRFQVLASLFPLHYIIPPCNTSSGIFFLDATLRVGVHEAGAAAGRLGGAAATHARGAVVAELATKTEEDGGEEEGGGGRPRKAHDVLSNVGFLAGGAEGVASFDDPCAGDG